MKINDWEQNSFKYINYISSLHRCKGVTRKRCNDTMVSSGSQLMAIKNYSYRISLGLEG